MSPEPAAVRQRLHYIIGVYLGETLISPLHAFMKVALIGMEAFILIRSFIRQLGITNFHQSYLKCCLSSVYIRPSLS